MDSRQLREYIVRPALKAVDLHSLAAENLIMGTAAQESHLEYVKQLGTGPALGLFQMEPTTYWDIWENYLEYRPELAMTIQKAIDSRQHRPQAERMMWDFRLATIMCRLQYLRVSSPLPGALDIRDQAAYWKKHYNTELGAGTEQEFIDNYRRIQT